MDSTQDSGSMFGSLNFQRIVIIIAIIMLIAALIFIGYALYKQSNDVKWPPETPQCPDFWTMDASGNCTRNPKTVENCEYNGIPAGTQGMPTCPPDISV